MKKLLVLTALIMIAAVTTQAAVVWWAGDLLGGDGNYANGNSWSVDAVNPYGSEPLATDENGLITDWVTSVMPTISSAISQAPTTLGIGWDQGSGELNVVAGGSITGPGTALVVGYDGANVPANEGILNISGGSVVVGGALVVGAGANHGIGTLNLSGGLLYAGDLVLNDGIINMSNDAKLWINGDLSSLLLVDWGWMTVPAGKSSVVVYNIADDRTEWSVIPEPATLGLLAILGLAFLRRK